MPLQPRQWAGFSVAVCLALAIAGLFVFGPAWSWITQERVYIFEAERYGSIIVEAGKGFRGYQTRSRWSGKITGPQRLWSIDTGKLVEESWWKDDSLVRGTFWYADGRIDRQRVGRRHVDGPPWSWEVTEQTEPTMPPWMQDDARWREEAGPEEVILR